MTPSDFAADLPAPRDDEPASLRADIVDELADHLQCAVRREQLRAGQTTPISEPWGSAPRDEAEDGGAEPRRSQAYQRVLARFGDPAAVARKLWWDAMRERMMEQRILTGLTALAVAACCVMAVLMWQMLSQMQKAQRDLLAESQAQNARLLEQFQAMIGELNVKAESDGPPEWVSLTMKCTFDTEDGPPAAGVKVDLRGNTDRTLGIGGEQSSDAAGVIDFGKVLYARYDISCTTPGGMSLRESVSVRPGQAKVVKIVCPRAPPPRHRVQFDIQPPEALRSLPLYYVAVVETATQVVAEREWKVDSSTMNVPCYLLGADGKALGEIEGELSKRLREKSRGRGMGGGVIDASMRQQFQDLQIVPMSERPAYRLSGPMIALLADTENQGEVPPGRLPALIYLTTSRSRRDSFETSPEDMTNRLVRSGDSFWIGLGQQLLHRPDLEVYDNKVRERGAE